MRFLLAMNIEHSSINLGSYITLKKTSQASEINNTKKLLSTILILLLLKCISNNNNNK